MPNKFALTSGAVATAIFVTALAQPVAAKTIKMVAVSGAPPIVTYVRASKDYFMPEIDKRLAASGLDFKIQWTGAYSQSLAKMTEVFEAVEEGIAQVCLCLKTFEPSSLPLEQYLYMAPFGRQSLEQVREIDNAVRAKVPAMNKMLLDRNHVYLTSGSSQTMQLFTKFPVKSIDDLKSKKLGASGSMGHWLRGTGAVVVNANMAASFTDIRNGLYDGYPISVSLAFPYKTYEAAKNMTRVHFGVSATSFLTVNRDAWDGLPPKVQKIFRDVAEGWGPYQARIDRAKHAKFTGIMKKKGMKITDMSDAERKRWAKSMPNIAMEWVKNLEKRKVPGRAVLTAFMDELRARKIDIARQWDRE
ncbi:MAG: TRAP transporter substrate-binding protein DctP [Rhodospirillaceae bacterium]|jgi:TRAP-type transport system periplasmic protein|nr:TRAP transporter substrate-binding protein DctP [Rhodospirillaceae bacterium]MBT3885293.1 TRAP transporter substrate-binding protein DctP [Rhodospirillaceae bacterium]MBT4116105.1 TRAP transporter substrate-binding protein DctP [Rhodospirillaceae bacterium]MBT4674717.1 TRAP transporter substrate-binding protein DctP [Rhodospirillaceae bacterium]MBT4721130.1 TRAP transporter substrate-binding protein DctP [Rhodospirillaceae bacterium]